MESRSGVGRVVGIVILTEAKKRAAEIAEFASQPDNWYRIGVSPFVPGDRKEYVLKSGDHTAVFTFTMVPLGKVYRHMTVSVPRKGKFPQPLAVWTLAHYFGFTGATVNPYTDTVAEPAEGWAADTNEEQGCIVVQQEVEGV